MEGFVTVFCPVEEVWMVSGSYELRGKGMDETYEAFFSSMATFIKLTC